MGPSSWAVVGLPPPLLAFGASTSYQGVVILESLKAGTAQGGCRQALMGCLVLLLRQNPQVTVRSRLELLPQSFAGGLGYVHSQVNVTGLHRLGDVGRRGGADPLPGQRGCCRARLRAAVEGLHCGARWVGRCWAPPVPGLQPLGANLCFLPLWKP